jgi:hypothetical protein
MGNILGYFFKNSSGHPDPWRHGSVASNLPHEQIIGLNPATCVRDVKAAFSTFLLGYHRKSSKTQIRVARVFLVKHILKRYMSLQNIPKYNKIYTVIPNGKNLFQNVKFQGLSKYTQIPFLLYLQIYVLSGKLEH